MLGSHDIESTLQTLSSLLRHAGRPLHLRRLAELGLAADGFGPAFDDAGIEAVLEHLQRCAASPGAGRFLKRIRPGVFAHTSGASEHGSGPLQAAVSTPPDDGAADGVDRNGRRRRRKTADLAGDSPVAPLSIDDAVDESEAASDSQVRLAALWAHLEARAMLSVGLEAGLTSASEPAQSPPVAEKAASPARSRLKTKLSERQREKAAEAAAVPAQPAPTFRTEELHLALAQHQAEFEQHLVDRLRDLGDAAFVRLVTEVSLRAGLRDLEVMGPAVGGKVLLMGRSDDDAAVPVAVVARRSSADMSAETVGKLRPALMDLGAERAVVLHTGGFSDAARALASLGPRGTLTLIDGMEFARFLLDHELGARPPSVQVAQIDEAFFATLG